MGRCIIGGWMDRKIDEWIIEFCLEWLAVIE